MWNLIIEWVPDNIIKSIWTKISYKNFNSSIFVNKKRIFNDLKKKKEKKNFVKFWENWIPAKEVLAFLKEIK